MVAIATIIRYALVFALPCRAIGNMKTVDTIEREVLEQRGWTVQRTPATEEAITLQIGLTLQNEDALIAKLKDVSDPKSPNYAKFLDRDEANQIAKPALDSAVKVTNWLNNNGVTQVHNDGFWVTFRTTISKANELLNADFMQYQNNGVSKIRTAAYSVPTDVAEHIALIHPTTFFGKTQAFKPIHIDISDSSSSVTTLERRQRDRPVPKNAGSRQDLPLAPTCRNNITPDCLKQLYNVGTYTPSADSGSKIAFGSFLNESSSHSDLRLYTDHFKIPFQDVTKVNINDASDDQGPGASNGEANLDVQNMVGVGHPLPVTEYLTGGSPPFVPDLDVPDESKNTNEPYVPYYQYLLSKTNAELPQAISNSYGEPEHTVPKNYAQRTCTMVAVLGLRGITVFESSGDTGIGSNCLSNDGKGGKEFNSQFPGTCPWITSVGGTEAVQPAIAWRDSSGGFSDYFPRPWYQVDAVNTYLTKYIPAPTLEYYKSFFNRDGRAFPDISAHSLTPNYQVYVGGRLRGSGGTSAASPVWAALVGLLNDARLRAKKPTMGFINPWLYANGGEFITDITKGGTRGCSGINFQTGLRFQNAGIIPFASWNSTIGWDPATGLGIPDFQKMLKSAMGLVGN